LREAVTLGSPGACVIAHMHSEASIAQEQVD